MHRDDLVSMGLFSERLKIYGFIGQEFMARARHYGFRYQYNPAAGIIHDRQPVGDNQLTRWRRKWQIAVARALRPSLMNARQYALQVAWARRMSENFPRPCARPAIPHSAWLAFPYRFARQRAGDLRKALRRAGS
jgi:hypothetical protein